MHLDLICLGVGKGSSHVVNGETSSAFCLRRDGAPWLLVDCGLGVLRACLAMLGVFPPRIFITHNHTDHAGDLPTAINYYAPHIYGHADVLEFVRLHRLHDGPITHRRLIEAAVWTAADADGALDLGDGFTMQLRRSSHEYTCYGFVLRYDGTPLLGYSADSAFDEAHYAAITAAPLAIVDGRESGGAQHATFAEIDAYAARVPETTLRVIHHGEAAYHDDAEPPYHFHAPNVRLLAVGACLPLL
jgi:ribonuclease BN (tRNA processing enzyme)